LSSAAQEVAATPASVPPAGEVPSPPPQPASTRAPTSWPKEAKAEWPELPAVVQAAIAKREREIDGGLKKYANRKDDYELGRHVREGCAPLLDEMRAMNCGPVDVIALFLHWHKALQTAGPAALDELRQRYGIRAAVYPHPPMETYR
jgi:hypothetical protein